jgi:hypothetical protein
MINPLELHVSGLREGEIPTFRIPPVGANPDYRQDRDRG